MLLDNFVGWMLAGVAILFMLWLALRAETRKARGDLETREERMLREMSELEHTVKTLLTKLNESQREIDDLRVQLKTALNRITELEVMYEIQPGNAMPIRLTPKRKLIRPLLVICGPDTNIVGPNMEAGLDAIGVRYTRLLAATQADISDELTRAREDGRMYRWLLIYAHAGPGGVTLNDGVASPDFWMKQIIGLEVVGIAACKGTNIADHLRDRAGFVWYFKEGVPGDAANRFVQKFFQRLNGGETPETAFIACLDAVPEVAPYADYRAR